jgi:enoyl-[acyl-carrier protein] reductase I
MTPLTPTEAFFRDIEEQVKGPVGALAGKRALVIGIANKQSIAYGCALAFRALGASVAITYLNEKSKPYTQPLADHLGVDPELYLPCDVRVPGQLEAVFEAIGRRWGRLDIALHSIAFAPREDLHGRVTDCSREGFLMAMDVSCHSFIRGPVKAALEASARYLAAELGARGIRVHPISPGPIKTRAATGIDRFDELMEIAASRAPSHTLATIEDVGMATAFLASDYARLITGDTLHIDGGYHIVG